MVLVFTSLPITVDCSAFAAVLAPIEMPSVLLATAELRFPFPIAIPAPVVEPPAPTKTDVVLGF